MRIAPARWQGIICVASLLTGAAVAWGAEAEEKPRAERPKRIPKTPVVSPGEKLEDGWQDDDPQLEVWGAELAYVEELLLSIDAKRNWSTQDRNAQKYTIKKADERTVRNLNNGGGPIRWQKFYGGSTVNAFYMPGASRTVAVLDRYGNAGMSVSQGAPQQVKRPPQFDYIQKGIDKRKQDAQKELASLASKHGALDERRRQLETEQLMLWCQISFHNILHQHVPERPLYRFDLKPHVDSEMAKHDESMRAAVRLMDEALRIAVELDQAGGKPIHKLAPPITKARLALTDAWRKQGEVFEDSTKKQRELRYPRDKFVRLAELLEDHGKIVDDSYPRALKHAQSPAESKLDDPQQNWNQLSDSLIAMAAVVLALDETALVLASDWDAKPDLDNPLPTEQVVAQQPEPTPVVAPDPAVPPATSGFDLARLREIRIQQQKGKKRTWASFQVTHKGGAAYITRADGSKVPLKLEGDTLSWDGPKGGDRKVDVVQKKTEGGNRVDLRISSN